MGEPGDITVIKTRFLRAAYLPEKVRGARMEGFPGVCTLFLGEKEAQTFFSHPQITTIINKECAAPVYITRYTGMAWCNRMQRSGT
jgi:hypothetical protein